MALATASLNSDIARSCLSTSKSCTSKQIVSTIFEFRQVVQVLSITKPVYMGIDLRSVHGRTDFRKCNSVFLLSQGWGSTRLLSLRSSSAVNTLRRISAIRCNTKSVVWHIARTLLKKQKSTSPNKYNASTNKQIPTTASVSESLPKEIPV